MLQQLDLMSALLENQLSWLYDYGWENSYNANYQMKVVDHMVYVDLSIVPGRFAYCQVDLSIVSGKFAFGQVDLSIVSGRFAFCQVDLSIVSCRFAICHVDLLSVR